MNLLITGVSGYLGQAIVRSLIHENPFGRVIGLDRAPPEVLGPVHLIATDLATVDLGDLLVMNDIDIIVHLARSSEREARGTDVALLKKVLEAAENVGVRRLVIPSRDRVYEPSKTPCTEGAPLRPLDDVELLDIRLHEERLCEDVIAAFDCPKAMEVVVPRLAAVIGSRGIRGIDGALSSRWLFVPRGQGTFGVQFIHVGDASNAIIKCAVQPGLAGCYNVAGSEPLSMEAVSGILQSKLVFVPARLFHMALRGLETLGLLRCRPIDFIRLWLATPVVTEKADKSIGAACLSSRQALAFWRVDSDGPGSL